MWKLVLSIISFDVVFGTFSLFSSLPDVALTRGPIGMHGITAGKHPVVIEMGKERKCGPMFFPQNFMEFKFEIPYVRAVDSSDDVVYKQKIVVDNYLNVIFTGILYKINTSFAKIEMTENSYSFSMKGGAFDAAVTDTGEWGGFEDNPELELYETIANMPWSGDNNVKICAQHNYRFPDIQSRPVAMDIALNWNVVHSGMGFDGSFSTPPITNSLSAIEVIVDTTISSPQPCSRKFI